MGVGVGAGVGVGVREGGEAALGVGLAWKNLFCFVSTSGFTTPMLIFPANDGIRFRPPLSSMIFGTRLSLIVFLIISSSAVLFLAPPNGPGHPSQPSLVSLLSPSQVG